MRVVRRAVLKMLSPLHLGEHGIGLERSSLFPHSDTLFSALCFAWAERFGQSQLEQLLESFLKGSPPFLLSSAFPYFREIRLYPRPRLPLGDITPPHQDPELYEEIIERTKDVRWVSGRILGRWLANADIAPEISPENIVGDIWITSEERNRLQGRELRPWTSEPAARVALDRITSASNLYYVGQVHFARDGGLFLYVASEGEEVLKEVQLALHHLGEMGLGGERSLGYGRFKVNAWETVDWPARSSKFVTLSLYHPTQAETESGILRTASYQLIRREGYVTSPAWPGRRRKWVLMLEEGSVLEGDSPTYGDLLDVTPQSLPDGAHTVYRYGFAFPLPISKGEGQYDTCL